MNRCPSCEQEMVVDSEYELYCEKCGYPPYNGIPKLLTVKGCCKNCEEVRVFSRRTVNEWVCESCEEVHTIFELIEASHYGHYDDELRLRVDLLQSVIYTIDMAIMTSMNHESIINLSQLIYPIIYNNFGYHSDHEEEKKEILCVCGNPLMMVSKHIGWCDNCSKHIEVYPS